VNDVRFHKHKGEQMSENVYSQFVFKDGMIHFIFDADRPIKKGEQVRTRRRAESVSCLHRAVRSFTFSCFSLWFGSLKLLTDYGDEYWASMANIIRWEHKQFAVHMLPRVRQLEEHCRERGIQLPEPPPCQSHLAISSCGQNSRD